MPRMARIGVLIRAIRVIRGRSARHLNGPSARCLRERALGYSCLVMTELPLRFDECTWEEVDRLPRDTTVLILPVGSTEPHGPHLPLSTDVVLSEGMSRRAALMLRDRGVVALTLPPIAYSVTDFAGGFAGAVSLRLETAHDVLVDVLGEHRADEVLRPVPELGVHGVGRAADVAVHRELEEHLAGQRVDAAVVDLELDDLLAARSREVARAGGEQQRGGHGGAQDQVDGHTNTSA